MKGDTICAKIIEVFPDIGTCGIEVNVEFDDGRKAWAVDLERNGHHLKTYLEVDEAENCVAGKECLSLGLQVGRLRENIVEMTRF